MRFEACASAGDVIAPSERSASMAAIRGAERLRRNGKRFICRGFHLLGQEALRPAEYIVRRTRQRKPCAGFYRHFMNRVETWSCEPRGFDDRIRFFSGLRFLTPPRIVAPVRRKAGHATDSLLEWRSSPQNNNRTSTE